MKKRYLLILVITLILSVSLFGCSGDSTPQNGGGTQTDQLTLMTGPTGGTYFALGGAMASTWSKHIDGIQVTSQPSGASVENINLINAGEAHLGLIMNNIADDAWFGRGAWNAPVPNFRAIGVVYPEVYQGIALANSGITSINDLPGKKVAVGPVGSGTVLLSEAIFAEVGLTFADMRAEYDGFGDAANKMKDGHLHANFGVLGVPASNILDIASVRDINIIEIDEDLYNNLKEKYPFFNRYLIPAGTYGNEKDVWTINCQAALYVSSELDEDLVYEITKVFYENAVEVAAAHASGEFISLETALDGITTPLHAGALKYYLEQGIDVLEEIR